MKLLKMKVLAGLILSTIYAGIAQNPKQANIWYFGLNAGLDFTYGTPVAISNSGMEAFEGTATICDNSGKLLFYTNGGNQPFTGAIWNRNHQVMPNGYLENLAGCASSIQSSLILKRPGSSSFYYVFTTDCYENSFVNGLSYSIVDLSLDGGLGDVVVKGQILETEVTESLTAAAHANGKDYWVITHKVNTDSFFAYQLTQAGISGVVKSKIGPVADEFVGEIKVSGNGERLAFGGNSFTALFDFNSETGVISNYRNLSTPCFTISFSPNCELLYGVNLVTRQIFQFDLLATNIAATKKLVGSSTDHYIGSLQIGPDNKIYVALRNSQYVGVITRPNVKGANCNFIKNDIYLNGKTGKYGLPNYPNNVVGECLPYPRENATTYEPEFLVKNVSSRGIILELSLAPDATEYRVSRRKKGSSEWESLTFETPVIANENLEQNTGYEFRVDAVSYSDYMYEFVHEHGFAGIVDNNEKTEELFQIATSEVLTFDVFPNPASNQANIEVLLKKNSTVEFNIMDLSGKVVLQNSFEGKSGLQRFELPLNDINDGIYQLSLKCGSLKGYQKLVVVN